MNAREEILSRLRSVPATVPEARPLQPPFFEQSLDREKLVEKLIDELTKLEAIVYHLRSEDEVREKLGEIMTAEGITKALASTDEVVSSFDLPLWGQERGLKIYLPSDFTDRESFKWAAFEEVEAGITGVDFAVAESGTLVVIHNSRQPRLISLAPITHIALLPTSRVVPVYESTIREVLNDNREIPSQITFITGPSMTADIKATPFKGMHGPRRLIVIIYETK